MSDDAEMCGWLADVGHSDDDRHYPALERLLDMGAAARDRLLALLQTGEPRLRWKCADVLGRMNDGAVQRAFVGIIRDDPDPILRGIVIPALKDIADPATVPVFIAALQDADFKVRRWAASILGNFRAPETIAPLTLALQDEDEWVRLHAASSLRFTHSVEVKKMAEHLRDHGHERALREHALHVLWEWDQPE